MMKTGKITQKQAVIMIVMFIIGSSCLLVMGLEAKMDIWLAILLAVAATSLVMLIYARLLTILPQKDFFETLAYFLGPVGSKIFLVLLTWFAFQNCALVLRNYGQFVITVGLPETPLAAAMFIMMLPCIAAVKGGLQVLGRWSETFIFIVVSFLLISVLMVSKNMEISHLLPVLDEGVRAGRQRGLRRRRFPACTDRRFSSGFPGVSKGGIGEKGISKRAGYRRSGHFDHFFGRYARFRVQHLEKYVFPNIHNALHRVLR